MAKQLPIVWSEVEKAALAGVPLYDIAAKLADSVPELQGCDVTRLYATIRKRASRERWPMPDAILRRAQAKARVEAGVAGDAKQANQWRKGEDGLNAIAESKRLMGISVPQDSSGGGVEHLSPIAPNGSESCGFGAGGGLATSPPTAENLVTADLAALGQRGLRAILNRATIAAEAMIEAPEVRSWQDVQTMTKVISQAAGLDRPAVAIAVSLNSGANATITGWESIESENLSQM
jgi:hypothetical protein